MPVAVSSAGRSLAVVLVAAVATCGCTGWIVARAVASVRAALPTDSPVLSRLRTTSNPRGSGVVVYVPSTAACGPEVLWVANHETYALDARSQALTPGLRRVGRSVCRRVCAAWARTHRASRPPFDSSCARSSVAGRRVRPTRRCCAERRGAPTGSASPGRSCPPPTRGRRRSSRSRARRRSAPASRPGSRPARPCARSPPRIRRRSRRPR